jgi:thioredoxin 1
MVHTEAAGYAELSFDASLRKYLDEDQLVLVCTIGRNLGGVLYKGGHRMRNIGLNRSITKTFEEKLGRLERKYKDVWMRVQNANYLLPPLPGIKSNKSSSEWPANSGSIQAPDKASQWPRTEGGSQGGSSKEVEESWLEWVQLVDSYLIQLADYVKPTCIILMPTGAYTSGPLVETMMPELKVQNQAISKPSIIPVSSAIGALVKGAAVGAIVELKVQEAIATLRQAVGGGDIVQISNLSEEQLRAAFDYFDEDGDGNVTEEKLKNGLQALGPSLSPDVIAKKLSSINTSVKGEVTFAEFKTWWNVNFKESPVTLITSESEFKEILKDPFPTQHGDSSKDSPVMLQIGFSFCRPCKRFEPKFEAYAKKHQGIRFVRMNGNENEDTIHFCKEELMVRKTPSFFIFKNEKQVSSWTGANEDVFKGKLSKLLSGMPKQQHQEDESTTGGDDTTDADTTTTADKITDAAA